MNEKPRKNKRLGQHHLRDGALCGPAIRYLELEGAAAVEIGPGGGVLTRELLAAGAIRVTALELDPSWAAFLERQRDERLQVVIVDALQFSWSALQPGVRVTGNLPYNIASPLMERLLDQAPPETRCSFLVQKEMADRWCASPGGSDYGSFSVLMAARCSEIRTLGRVKPGSFDPPPKVDSAFVGLTLAAPDPSRQPWTAFKSTVRAAFVQRRKTVLNSLGSSWGKPAARDALEQAEIDPALRAERLGLGDFDRLHRARQRAEN